jgi:hypothetical protein
MSSIAPEHWDEFLSSFEAVSLAPTTSSASPPSLPATSTPSSAPSTSTASGEFKPFLSLASSLVAEGGGAKKTFALVSCSDRGIICGGQIGTAKFCLKPKTGFGSCDAASHVKSPFEFPAKSLYLKENEIRAWCEPRFDASFLSPEQLHLLLGLRLPKEEWVELFELLLVGIAPGWLFQLPDSKIWSNFAPQTSPTSVLPTIGIEPSNEQGDSNAKVSNIPANAVEILSPRFTDSAIFLNGFPSLSFDDISQEDDVPYSTLTMEQIGDVLHKFTKRFMSLKTKWTSAFSDVEANYLVVVKDLTDLQRFTNSMASTIGQPDPSQSDRNLWDHLKTLHATAVEQIQSVMHSVDDSAASVNAIVHDHTLLQSSVAAVEEVVTNTVTSLQQRLHQVETTLHSFDSRFARLLPVLKHLQASRQSAPTSTTPDATVLNQIQELRLQVQKLQDTLWTQSLVPSHSTAASNDVTETLLDLKAQLKLLQIRIVGDGVQIGARVFQSFEDVQAWVVSDLPIRRYGLFVDAVSLLDFFTSIGHVEAEKTFSSFYSQYKTGFASMYEARVAASVQNLFPMIFGKSDASGLDASESLPAVTNPEKWDNGATGLRYQISRSMGDVEYQLESTIDSVLADYPDARQIARECLYKSKRFVMELCSFMTQDYLKWKHRGHSNKEAWRMTTVCVRRIFEEIHSERIIAKDVYDQADKDFTTARFLWATWKAHTVMARYLKHQFYEHPSIAAVLARHLADNYVKPDEHLGAKLKDLEKQFKTYTSKVDYLVTKDPDGGPGKRKAKADKTEQSKKDQAKDKNGTG